MKIFISYAHIDLDLVREKVVDVLRDGGHEPWFDHSLTVGKEWKPQLSDAIHNSDVFLYALTSESLASEWCRWELGEAQALKKPIIPVLLRSCTIPDELAPLRELQYVDYTGKNYPPITAVAKLMGGLNQFTPIPKPLDTSSDPSGVPSRAIHNPVTEAKRIAYEKAEADRIALEKRKRALPALRWFNPLDWLRLYGWLFFRADQLIAHRDLYEEQSERSSGAWLVSTMTFLPLFIPTLAGSLSLFPWDSAGVGVAWVWLTVIVAVWALMGRLGKREDNPTITISLGFISFVIFFSLIFDISLPLQILLTSILIFTGGLSGMILGNLAGFSAFTFATALLSNLIGKLVFDFVGGVAFGNRGYIAYGIVFLSVLILTLILGWDMRSGLKSSVERGTSTPWTRALGLVAPLAYAFMVWFYFLGGWQVMGG